MSDKRYEMNEELGGDEAEQNDTQPPHGPGGPVQDGAVTTTKGKYTIHCLTIVGQVEGHYILPPQNKTTKYEHVIPQLVAIQENPEIEGLIIILNTVGGDVEAGLAIAELVSGMDRPTVSLVLGGGHSIGVPLAVSARQSFIVPSATMTIHPVRMNGVVLGVPQTLSYFDKMQERIVRFVEQNSGIDAKKFRELMMNTGELVMDVGTVLDGAAAVKCGLIDHLGGLSDAIDCLYDMIDEDKRSKAKEAGRCRREDGRHGGGRRRSGHRQQRIASVPRPARRVRPMRAASAVPPDYAYGATASRAGQPLGREHQNSPPDYRNTTGTGPHKDRPERGRMGGGFTW